MKNESFKYSLHFLVYMTKIQNARIVKQNLSELGVKISGIKYWYGVVMGHDGLGYARVKPLTHEESKETFLLDRSDDSALYAPTPSESAIVRAAFADQIDAIMAGKPYPTLDDACSYSFKSAWVDAIPDSLRARAQGDPTKLEVAVKMSRGFSDLEEKAPDGEQVSPFLHNFGFLNLVYLAKLAGFDGLFEVGLAREPVVTVKRMPIYGFVSSHKVFHYQDATAQGTVRGLAYRLNSHQQPLERPRLQKSA